MVNFFELADEPSGSSEYRMLEEYPTPRNYLVDGLEDLQQSRVVVNIQLRSQDNANQKPLGYN
jgi:hypothetical protein